MRFVLAKQETSLLTVTGKPKFFYGYIIVLVAFLVMMVAHGLFSTFGVFFNPLLAEFGWSRATISGASSLCFLINGFLAIIVGGLTDRFGPRIVMTIWGLFLGLGYLLMSQINSIWQLYLFYGVITGIGLSAGDVLPLSTIARWFVRKRGMMSGIAKVGTGLGMFIMPLVASGLILAYDWRTSYIILGTIALVFISFVAQLLRRDPGQMGQLPDGEKQADAEPLDLVEEGLSLWEAIHTRRFWMICPAYLTIFFCTQTITVHIAPYAVDLGISAINAAGILSIIGGISMGGRLVMGGAGDKIGNRRAIIICFLILVAALFWLQVAKELWMLYLFAVMYGFAHGGFFALISPMIAELFGIRSQGIILGAVIFSGALGGAVGPVLAGHMFDVMDSYQLAFLVCAIIAVVGLIVVSLLKPITGKGGTNDPRRSARFS